MIACIQIGNSDNKLTQQEWSKFVAECKIVIGEFCAITYFFSPSPGDASWQNACWVIAVNEADIDALKRGLVKIRKRYMQDAIAVVIGPVQNW